jgi:hypothetical protein
MHINEILNRLLENKKDYKDVRSRGHREIGGGCVVHGGTAGSRP